LGNIFSPKCRNFANSGRTGRQPAGNTVARPRSLRARSLKPLSVKSFSVEVFFSSFLKSSFFFFSFLLFLFLLVKVFLLRFFLFGAALQLTDSRKCRQNLHSVDILKNLGMLLTPHDGPPQHCST
jgi:hypothetical protein